MERKWFLINQASRKKRLTTGKIEELSQDQSILMALGTVQSLQPWSYWEALVCLSRVYLHSVLL